MRLARVRWCVAAVACGLLASGHLAALLAAAGPSGALPAFLGLVLGLLAVDALGGLVHWACDTWGDEETAWIGESVIRSFREHHRAPWRCCAGTGST